MLGTITKGEYNNAPIPDNVYLAKLVKVKEKAPPEKHPDWFPSLQWSFQILTDPLKGRYAFGKTPTNWIAGKKLDNWLVTLGINVGKGTSIKIEDLKDMYVKILVKNKHYQDPVTKEDKAFPEVKELLSLDSLDQIKIRELVAGASAASVSTQPVVTAPVTVTATHTFTPSVTTPVAPTVVNPVSTFTNPTTTFTPAPNVTAPTSTPNRTIPF
jgi:hypothetical protein